VAADADEDGESTFAQAMAVAPRNARRSGDERWRAIMSRVTARQVPRLGDVDGWPLYQEALSQRFGDSSSIARPPM
jgi:hypothetical protein